MRVCSFVWILGGLWMVFWCWFSWLPVRDSCGICCLLLVWFMCCLVGLVDVWSCLVFVISCCLGVMLSGYVIVYV